MRIILQEKLVKLPITFVSSGGCKDNFYQARVQENLYVTTANGSIKHI